MKNMPNPYTLHTSDVVIRDDDHQFWKGCIAELEDPKKRNRVAIVGTPGIGKTTTSSFAIRMLLKMGRTVVYLYRTEDKSNNYIQMTPEPGTNNVTIEHFPESTSATDIPALQEKETYYVVDPGQTKKNSNPEGGVMANVIIVASPDERLWGTAFGKKEPGRDPGMFRYFPPWSLRQLKTSAGYIDSVSISAGEIEELFTLFAGIPRLIYDPDEKDENMAILERKVNDLDLAQMKKLLSGRENIHVDLAKTNPEAALLSSSLVKVFRK